MNLTTDTRARGATTTTDAAGRRPGEGTRLHTQSSRTREATQDTDTRSTRQLSHPNTTGPRRDSLPSRELDTHKHTHEHAQPPTSREVAPASPEPFIQRSAWHEGRADVSARNESSARPQEDGAVAGVLALDRRVRISVELQLELQAVRAGHVELRREPTRVQARLRRVGRALPELTSLLREKCLGVWYGSTGRPNNNSWNHRLAQRQRT